MNEELRSEAVARLNMLAARGLSPNVVKDFERRGELSVSDRCDLRIEREIGSAPAGILHRFDVYRYPDIVSVASEVERDYGGLVYHVTHEVTDIGEFFDFFWVSSNTEEWPLDRAGLGDGLAFCYVYNETDPDLSEFGTVAFGIAAGGVIRIG